MAKKRKATPLKGSKVKAARSKKKRPQDLPDYSLRGIRKAIAVALDQIAQLDQAMGHLEERISSLETGEVYTDPSIPPDPPTGDPR